MVVSRVAQDPTITERARRFSSGHSAAWLGRSRRFVKNQNFDATVVCAPSFGIVGTYGAVRTVALQRETRLRDTVLVDEQRQQAETARGRKRPVVLKTAVVNRDRIGVANQSHFVRNTAQHLGNLRQHWKSRGGHAVFARRKENRLGPADDQAAVLH